MKKIKYLIGFLLLFMVIGFAVVATSLSIRGTTTVANTLDDFKVYFSDVKVNDNQDLSLIREDTRLYFDILLEELGDSYVIEYDVTNGSKYYDADITMSCTLGNEYLSIVNNFNTTDNLLSKETRSGTLTLSKIKTMATDKVTNNVVVCELTAVPVERTSLGSGTANGTVNLFYIGREIAIGEEKFNIISEQEDTITMLTKYNISNGSPYKQTLTQIWVPFSSGNGWEYIPGPKEIEVQEWSTYPKELINNYVNYLQSLAGEADISGNLVTLNELKLLGCLVTDDYSFETASENRSCISSPNHNWLLTGQYWWTRSASSTNQDSIWTLGEYATIYTEKYSNYSGIRPTITIPKELARRLISYKNYDIGDVITIGTEKFNVIEDNAMSVTMLAQYNLGTDYRQTTTNNYVDFSNTNGWEYSSANEIDIQEWSTNPKLYVNEYVSYLSEYTGDDSLSGDLITLKKLKVLGCNIIDSYSWSSSANCLNTEYDTWLNTGQRWWTQSASTGGEAIWIVHIDKSLQTNIYTVKNGVRPVITISKDALVKYN